MLLLKERDILYFLKLLGGRNPEMTAMLTDNTACAVSNQGLNLVEGIVGHLFPCPPTCTAQYFLITDVTGTDS